MSPRRDFEQRFPSETVSIDEARRRFINRVHVGLFDHLGYLVSWTKVAVGLGELVPYGWSIEKFTKHEFYKTLRSVEAFVPLLPHHFNPGEYSTNPQTFAEQGQSLVRAFIAECELDIGVEWDGRRFRATGASELDDGLVNDVLDWCKGPNLESIRKPLKKAIGDLLEVKRNPERGADIVGDVYEAVEAAGKWLTGSDKPLSGNRETIVAALGIHKYFDDLLLAFINWGNQYRHAGGAKRPKPAAIHYPEAEAYLYQGGLIIRLILTARGSAP